MKKIIIAVFLFSCLGYPTDLSARTGDKVEVWKKDGEQIIGELIRVKGRVLTLLDEEGFYVSATIDEAEYLIVRRKRSFASDVVLGSLIAMLGGDGIAGGASGGIWGQQLGPANKRRTTNPLSYGLPEKFQIEGKSPEEIDLILRTLRPRARYRSLEY